MMISTWKPFKRQVLAFPREVECLHAITPFHLLIQQRKSGWHKHVETRKGKKSEKRNLQPCPGMAMRSTDLLGTTPLALGSAPHASRNGVLGRQTSPGHPPPGHRTPHTELGVAASHGVKFKSFLSHLKLGNLVVPWFQDLSIGQHGNEHTGFVVERLCNIMLRAQALKLNTCVQILIPLRQSCDFEHVT